MVEQVNRQRMYKAYSICQQGVIHGVQSRAAWLFAAAWIVSAASLAFAGYGHLVAVASLVLLAVLFFSVFTLPFTEGSPTFAAAQDRPTSRAKLWIQLAIVLVFILFNGLRGMYFHLNLPTVVTHLPLLMPVLAFVDRFPFRLINPLLYFVLPMAVLFLTGMRWREVGLGPGYHSWRVTALWCSVLIITILVALVVGTWEIVPLLLAIVSNSLQNGFFEEFLFRGVLMSRLGRLLNNRWDWAIVLSSLIFGLWHLGVEASGFNENYLLGAAHSILMQAVYGLGFAIVTYRTRNLLASSIIHVLLNVAFG